IIPVAQNAFLMVSLSLEWQLRRKDSRDEEDDEHTRGLTVRIEELATLVADGGERSCGDEHGQLLWEAGFGSESGEEGFIESGIAVRLCRDNCSSSELACNADQETTRT